MQIRELAKYCESIGINCEVCGCRNECERMQEQIEDISPYGLVEMVDDNAQV